MGVLNEKRCKNIYTNNLLTIIKNHKNKRLPLSVVKLRPHKRKRVPFFICCFSENKFAVFEKIEILFYFISTGNSFYSLDYTFKLYKLFTFNYLTFKTNGLYIFSK